MTRVLDAPPIQKGSHNAMHTHNIPESSIVEVFVQGENLAKPILIRAERAATVLEIVAEALAQGLASPSDDVTIAVFIEDREDEIGHHHRLEEVGIGIHHAHVHLHRCRRIQASVTFNGTTKSRAFSPAATIAAVNEWADGQFHLTGIDATEHALQICGTAVRPDEDTHLGSLVRYPDCEIPFGLVAKKRVEG